MVHTDQVQCKRIASNGPYRVHKYVRLKSITLCSDSNPGRKGREEKEGESEGKEATRRVSFIFLILFPFASLIFKQGKMNPSLSFPFHPTILIQTHC